MKTHVIIFTILFSQTGFSQKGSFVEIIPQLAIHEKWSHLEEVLRDKRVVALGENLHGVKEYNSIKLELIKYLHEELGYNVLAIESDVAKNFYGNLHKSKIPDTTFLKELFTPPWHTEEYLELVRYLKSMPNLNIVGFDVEMKNTIGQIEEKLGVKVDTTHNHIKLFRENYSMWKEVNGRFLVTKSQRDSTMAGVSVWIVNELYPTEKIIISGHNDHVSNKEVKGACMGEILKNEFGDAYYSIGFFHSLGNPKHVFRNVIYENKESQLSENSIQYQLLKTGKSILFINIQNEKKSHENEWLFEELDNVLQANKFKYKLNLSMAFDGLIWIKKVTHPKYILKNKYLEK